jgi:opacity protein-like surface antigen
VAGISRYVIIATAAVMTSAVSHAADVPRLPQPAYVPPAPASGWSYSGWYLRGDLGSGWGMLGDVDVGGTPTTGDKLKSSVTAGAGVGLKTSFVRVDLTADYWFPAKYTGTLVAPNDITAKIQSINLLANGYLDLGTWYGLTPYVGAGAGAAIVKVTDVQGAASASDSRWNFAWAGMAGIAWTVAPNIQLDFGYRYLNVGKAESGGAAPVTFDRVAAHEVRLGVRWSFNDLPNYR